MSPLTLAQQPSLLLYPAAPAAGEEGCLERTLLWAASAGDAAWRTLPSQQVTAGDLIVQYRPCTVDVVRSGDLTKFYAFVQALIPLKDDLTTARRPNLYQDARQYPNSALPPAGFLA
jgi:hypothetical protein